MRLRRCCCSVNVRQICVWWCALIQSLGGIKMGTILRLLVRRELWRVLRQMFNGAGFASAFRL